MDDLNLDFEMFNKPKTVKNINDYEYKMLSNRLSKIKLSKQLGITNMYEKFDTNTYINTLYFNTKNKLTDKQMNRYCIFLNI